MRPGWNTQAANEPKAPITRLGDAIFELLTGQSTVPPPDGSIVNGQRVVTLGPCCDRTLKDRER